MTGLRRRRTVLYATIGVALLVAVLVGVIASVQPSSDLGANTPLLGDPAPAISGPSLGGGHLSLSEFRSIDRRLRPEQHKRPEVVFGGTEGRLAGS